MEVERLPDIQDDASVDLEYASHLAYGRCRIREELESVLAQNEVEGSIRQRKGITFAPLNEGSRWRRESARDGQHVRAYIEPHHFTLCSHEWCDVASHNAATARYVQHVLASSWGCMLKKDMSPWNKDGGDEVLLVSLGGITAWLLAHEAVLLV
jgi:hypothetical protein